MKPDHEKSRNPRTLTGLLKAWSAGSTEARDLVFDEVYAELRSLASLYLRNESRARLSIEPTMLVNEAYLRLVQQTSPWRDRAHFFGVAAQAMRRILVDAARRRKARKRSAPLLLTPHPDRSGPGLREIDVIRLDRALTKLALLDERQSQIVELRFFGGLTEAETAEALQVSPETVRRDWRLAKSWLRLWLSGANLDEA